MYKKKNGILGIGVATMDIYVNTGRMYPGGNEFNVACNAKFKGARAGFLGVFGDDEYGPILENTLIECGVELTLCRHEKGSSGYSLVRLEEDGDRVFLTWNTEGVTDLYPVQFTEEEMEYVSSYEVVSVGRCSTVTPEQIKKLYDHGIDVCYDFNDMFTEEDIITIAPHTAYGFFSSSHLSTDKIRETLRKAVESGCRIAIGTRGAGSIIAYDGHTFYEQSTFPVHHVLDALGAGDSYIGAFLADYLKNTDFPPEVRIQHALEAAARHAASVITIEGSIGVGYNAKICFDYDFEGEITPLLAPLI